MALVICRCMLEKHACGFGSECPHSKPHEFIHRTPDNPEGYHCENTGNIRDECECVPITLRHYVQRVIEKETTA